MAKNKAVFAICTSLPETEQALDALMAAGFRSDDISILAADSATTKQLATEKHTKAPEGAATGAVAGGAVGGTLGLLAGIGALAIPGLGPFIAAGPIMAALAGLGAGAATGGLVGALVGLGMPEYEAKRYQGRIKDGGILVSVHCDNDAWVKRAEETLKRVGAQDISSTSEEKVRTAS